MSNHHSQPNQYVQLWRNHFVKMASGHIPYTREFTVIASSNQSGKGYGKEMEKIVSVSPAAAAVEMAAASAEGYPHKSTKPSVKGKGTKKYKKPVIKDVSKERSKSVTRTEAF